jgi:NAD(P)-dependent dehydrogenase (short-subunit alcohol dehydrogenase family)
MDRKKDRAMNKKTVLITGCSSGFGELTARTFSDKGWSVIATMRSPGPQTALADLEDVLVTRLDVTDTDSIRQAVDEGLARFGAIDVLVNNAGFGGHSLFEQATDEVIRAMFETNVFGVMNVTRAVLPHMRRQKAGCIINVTSIVAMMGVPTMPVYCSTKFAIEGLTEAVDLEYRLLGIRAKTVAPGAYGTRFTANRVDHVTAGDQELTSHTQKLLDHMHKVVHEGPGLRPPGAPPADPQEVADKIYQCATSETPIHNPIGADAEMLIGMKSSMPHQVFLDKIADMLLPPQ